MAKKKEAANATPENPLGDRVEFATAHLRERLALLKGVAPRRASRKDCSCYHLVVNRDGTATVAATSLDVRMRVNLEVLFRSGHGTVLIDTHALDALVAVYPAPRITFSLGGDAAGVRARGNKVSMLLPAADPAKDLKAPVEGSLSTTGWLVRGRDLADALEKTRFATDDTSTRFALGGVSLEFPEGDETRMHLVATDGRRLARVEIPVRAHGDGPAVRWRPATAQHETLGLPILSCKALPAALKLARRAGDDPVALAVIPGGPKDLEKKTYVDGLVQVVTRDCVLTAKMPEGRFPDWKMVYPGSAPRAILEIADATELAEFMALAVAGVDGESKGVELILAGETLAIFASSGTKGKIELYLTVPGSKGRATMLVDALWFRQCLDRVGSSALSLAIHGPKEPLILRAAPGYEYILMPLEREQPGYVPPKPRPAEPAAEPEPKADEPEDEGDDDGGTAVLPEPEAPPAPAAAPARKGRRDKSKPSANGVHK